MLMFCTAPAVISLGLFLGAAVSAYTWCALTSFGLAYTASITLLYLGKTELNIAAMVDTVSMSFLFTVSTIAASVMAFSNSYMASEKFSYRFYLLMTGFVASMMTLIVSPNLLVILLGWDGLGVTSYLLIVYFNNAKASNAGMLTAVTNRVGDVAILIMIAVTSQFGSLSSLELAKLGPMGTATSSLIILAAMTKSAQIPFSAWLPAAMAAPTPVSSLVHSSTLVTAGVYLLIRFSPSLSTSLWTFVLVIGVMTMLMASASAMFEFDMKKIVALSTLSQLGMMFASLGLNLANLAMLHLLVHAFFKALLFISVGQLIHLSSDYQDLRNIGMGWHAGPTISMALLANLSLTGAPFLSGFFSKDAIMELSNLAGYSLTLSTLLYTSVLATSAYCARFMALIVILSANSSELTAANDSDTITHAAMAMLWPLATTAGAWLMWNAITEPLLPVLPLSLKVLPFLAAIAGTMAVLNLKSGITGPLEWSWGAMWAMPASSPIIILPILVSGYALRKVDQAWTPYLTLSTANSLSANAAKDPSWINFNRGLIMLLALMLTLLYLRT